MEYEQSAEPPIPERKDGKNSYLDGETGELKDLVRLREILAGEAPLWLNQHISEDTLEISQLEQALDVPEERLTRLTAASAIAQQALINALYANDGRKDLRHYSQLPKEPETHFSPKSPHPLHTLRKNLELEAQQITFDELNRPRNS